MQSKDSYIGIFSRKERNTKAMQQKTFFFVWKNSTGYTVQELNNSFNPVSNPVSISNDNFQNNFVREPTILVRPDSSSVSSQLLFVRTAKNGNRAANSATDFQSKNLQQLATENDITKESNNDSAICESELRKAFKKAMRRIRFPQERSAALQSLSVIADAEEGIIPEHKHMFTEFAIKLRQESFLDLALQCSNRVLALAPNDDHAHFNIARIYFELEQLTEAKRHLMKAIELDPNEKVYHRMLQHIEQHQLSK